MITGFLHQWDVEKRFFPKAFDTAIAFLRHTPVNSLQPGKHSIDGERIFASVQEATTEPMHMRRFELHRNYIDIQVLHTGCELQGYSPLAPTGKALEDRLDDADVVFYPAPEENEGLQTVLLLPGQFVIYLPGELHCPCCAAGSPATIFKTVLKIHTSCI